MSYTWSFSALKQYLNCPKQYHALKILKTYEQKVSEAMTYGTEVHKALENYVKDGTPLPTNYEKFKLVTDSLVDIEGTKHTEYEMAL